MTIKKQSLFTTFKSFCGEKIFGLTSASWKQNQNNPNTTLVAIFSQNFLFFSYQLVKMNEGAKSEKMLLLRIIFLQS